MKNSNNLFSKQRTSSFAKIEIISNQMRALKELRTLLKAMRKYYIQRFQVKTI
jgi:phosphopantothenate synthetase